MIGGISLKVHVSGTAHGILVQKQLRRVPVAHRKRRAFKQDTPSFYPIRSNEPYKVRREDLVTLKLALDDLRSNGGRVYQPCAYYHKVYAMALPSRGTAPEPEKSTLETLREQVLIEQARQEFKANKDGPAAIATMAPLALAPVVPHHIYDRKSSQQDERCTREGSADKILTTLSIRSRPLPKAANHQHYSLVDSGPIASGPKDHSLKDHSLEDPGLMDTHLMDANIGDHKVVDCLSPVQGVNGLPFQPPPDCGSLKLTLFLLTQMFPNVMYGFPTSCMIKPVVLSFYLGFWRVWSNLCFITYHCARPPACQK